MSSDRESVVLEAGADHKVLEQVLIKDNGMERIGYGAQKFYGSVQELLHPVPPQQEEGAQKPTAPAPPLTYLQAYAVTSQKYTSWEYITASQVSTVKDHGGTYIYVVTYEYGYGGSGIATYNGFKMTLARTDYVTSGGVVVAFYKYWYLANPPSSGTFKYQNTSLNSPWNTMYDSLNIK